MKTAPLSCMKLATLGDCNCLCNIAKCHCTTVKTKAEPDQFAEGLKTLGVLDHMLQYPDLVREFFVHDPRQPYCR